MDSAWSLKKDQLKYIRQELNYSMRYLVWKQPIRVKKNIAIKE